LSVVAQLLGDPRSGALLQDGALAVNRPCSYFNVA